MLAWIGFAALIVSLVALDLGLTHRRHERHQPMRPATALWWSLFWIGLSLAVGLGVWRFKGGDAAVEFYTGWLLEKALSVDNLFLFLLIFQRYRVPAAEQHRVLTWGVLGAIVLRAVMIFAGIRLIASWHAVIYVFAAFLVWTGLRTLFSSHEADKGEGALLKLVRRVLPIVPRYDDGRFFTRENGRLVGTMLLFVLVVIELSDVLFATDSLPAIFAITDDPFIIFSSNILAVLGLRALFFAIGHLLKRLYYLRFGLGVLLVVIGGKMALGSFVHIPAVASLGATVIVLGVTVVASLLHRQIRAPHEAT
jgi:tellurite resistance protein TerC